MDKEGKREGTMREQVLVIFYRLVRIGGLRHQTWWLLTRADFWLRVRRPLYKLEALILDVRKGPETQ